MDTDVKRSVHRGRTARNRTVICSTEFENGQNRYDAKHACDMMATRHRYGGDVTYCDWAKTPAELVEEALRLFREQQRVGSAVRRFFEVELPLTPRQRRFVELFVFGGKDFTLGAVARRLKVTTSSASKLCRRVEEKMTEAGLPVRLIAVRAFLRKEHAII